MKIVITKTGASLALAGALLFAAPAAAQATAPIDTAVTLTTVATASTADEGDDPSFALPATGIDAGALLGYWVGAGALALTIATVALATTIRRNRSTHDA